MRLTNVSYSKQDHFPNRFSRKTKNKKSDLDVMSKYDLSNVAEKEGLVKENIFMDELLSEIFKEIEKSKYMLDLKDDWDGEGAVAYDYLTWERTVNFLEKMAKTAIHSFNVVIDTPKIYHGSDGGIDMLWKTEKYKLLVDFPNDESESISFYGRTTTKETIKGTFTLNSGDNLMMFLIGAKQCL